ncbi:hypothetical protein AB1Y20_019019 [Prymnesium parvum]|uniref:non-specific serine/threonine protein kinase n=1 Tax=Prymnesium parvum TaxID=97485 RepID=A0AB34JU52_PRYPA
MSADDEESDEWADEEDLKDYRKGGYHPVQLGETFKGQRYRVLSKMGWGHFSTVWLATDANASSDARPVVLKIQKSAQRYAEAARDEVTLLRHVAELQAPANRYLVQLLDHFQHRGVNGTHQVMVFEPLGSTLLQLIKDTDYHGLPLTVVQTIARCVLTALDHLHADLGIIHTDLKPENVLCVLSQEQIDDLVRQATLRAQDAEAPSTPLTSESSKLSKNQKRRLKEKNKRQQAVETTSEAEAPPASPGAATARQDPRMRSHKVPLSPPQHSQLHFKVVDLGNACWRHHHFTEDVQTRQYRCPEVIIGAGFDTSCDMWSAACVFFEAATGDMLFNPRSGPSWSRDEDHLAMFMELLGDMPHRLTTVGKHAKKYFNKMGQLRAIGNLKYWDLESILATKYELDSTVAKAFAHFLLPMLDFDPAKRATARQVLDDTASWNFTEPSSTQQPAQTRPPPQEDSDAVGAERESPEDDRERELAMSDGMTSSSGQSHLSSMGGALSIDDAAHVPRPASSKHEKSAVHAVYLY